MRPLHVALIVGAALLALGGIAYVFTEGAIFSRGHHEWRVGVEPDGEGAWALFVPRIVSGDGPRGEALDALLATMEVTEGRAGFALDGARLRIDGEGPAQLVARREFRGVGGGGAREAFSDWRVPDLTVTHEEGPPLAVTWAVDFSGGEGHTCWASAQLHARVEPGGTRELQVAEGSGPAGEASRPWPVLCA